MIIIELLRIPIVITGYNLLLGVNGHVCIMCSYGMVVTDFYYGVSQSFAWL